MGEIFTEFGEDEHILGKDISRKCYRMNEILPVIYFLFGVLIKMSTFLSIVLDEFFLWPS
jgi:hypothetical protein